MSENFSSFDFREAVSIDAFKIYDSCADKDCLQNLRVLFNEENQNIIDQATGVRIRSADVISVNIDLEPLPFRKGFFSVDISYFFDANIDACISPCSVPMPVNGLCTFNKKIILFGSEGNVKIFSSDFGQETQNSLAGNLPRCTVQVAEPVPLSAKICTAEERFCSKNISCGIPEEICQRFRGEFVSDSALKNVFVSIGLFTIIQIERNVQLLVPTFDFNIPQKDCTSSSENPCDLFSKIDFPTDEFFPPFSTSENSSSNSNSVSIATSSSCGCGCR